ncbi:MAG: hypothetical protein HYZ29_18700, partial [Myxococcales bacterium]|nr:hypothetical protein [Myxococcales bacterium]
AGAAGGGGTAGQAGGSGGAAADSGTAGGTHDSGTTTDDSGCSCRTPSRRPDGPVGWLAGLAAALWLGRRLRAANAGR